MTLLLTLIGVILLLILIVMVQQKRISKKATEITELSSIVFEARMARKRIERLAKSKVKTDEIITGGIDEIKEANSVESAYSSFDIAVSKLQGNS